MTGVSRETGQPLDGWDHVRQSIAVILTTPIGSRVMRREFGSHLYKLIGRPMTKANILTVYAATALAISRWEPRFTLTGCELIQGKSNGVLSIAIYGIYNGTAVSDTLPLAA
ncbi:GPW/gp25 family protein [Sulfitobacter sp. W074]|uniref:GPW/gp25 family protein n=1 Tax=Sulfitobacter sp. W074 TaxID=2867026 RepID=UPI0021A6084F|nr:GPW/gp25 family protein [Sulfitobacter sp. W074]UWR36151.1 GPW/gp25 family protein [Sulfitobacter sp. W074]